MQNREALAMGWYIDGFEDAAIKGFAFYQAKHEEAIKHVCRKAVEPYEARIAALEDELHYVRTDHARLEAQLIEACRTSNRRSRWT